MCKHWNSVLSILAGLVGLIKLLGLNRGTVYSLQFTVDSVQFTVYSLKLTVVYSLQFTVYTLLCTIQCTVYTVYCFAITVYSSVLSAKLTVYSEVSKEQGTKGPKLGCPFNHRMWHQLSYCDISQFWYCSHHTKTLPTVLHKLLAQNCMLDVCFFLSFIIEQLIRHIKCPNQVKFGKNV